MYYMLFYFVCGLYEFDVHYVCVHMVEEKELSVVGCNNGSGVCTERTKAEVRID